jgi:hypothetical protein
MKTVISRHPQTLIISVYHNESDFKEQETKLINESTDENIRYWYDSKHSFYTAVEVKFINIDTLESTDSIMYPSALFSTLVESGIYNIDTIIQCFIELLDNQIINTIDKTAEGNLKDLKIDAITAYLNNKFSHEFYYNKYREIMNYQFVIDISKS